jgi:transglutaminase-like putative cysteine protease
MFYSIRHCTRFRYSAPVSESLMEVRMHPRTEGAQRCLTFQLSVSPRTRVTSYRDYLGNTIHHFDVPGHHKE